MRDPASLLPLLGALLGLLGLGLAFRAGLRRRLVENLPTSRTTGVFIGQVELKGTAESSTPLTSWLAEAPCVCYDWSVEEHWSRTVTETYTDDKGERRTRTRQESGWTTVDEGGERIPFYLQDDCGVILVRPEGATLEPLELFDETCSRGDPLYYAKGPPGAVSDSDHRRRFVEQGIPLKARLYVMGHARERRDVVAPEIAQDPDAPMFLVSTRTEEQIRSGMQWAGRGWGFFGLVAAVGCLVWRDAARGLEAGTRVPAYAAAGLGYLAAGLLAWVWMAYNSLVDLRQRVRAAWSQVDIQLKRRHELIPNLVACVKAYRDHEQRVQAELAALRAQLEATPPGVAGPDFGAVNGAIAVIAERYPELKANDSFRALQKSLVDTEQRIALARGYFNEIASHYNARLETVPERFVAALGAMRPQALMEANAFERAPVTVDLGAA